MLDPDVTGVQDHFSLPETIRGERWGKVLQIGPTYFYNPGSVELITRGIHNLCSITS